MGTAPVLAARRTPRRRVAGIGAAMALAAGWLGTAPAPAQASSGCRVSYDVRQWPGGFSGEVAVTNLGDALTRWTLEWDFDDASQRVNQAWNGVLTQSGRHVTIRNAAWNAALGTGATVRPGILGTWSTTDPVPASFTLNGVPCTGSVVPTPTPTSPSPTTPSPTTPSPTTASPTTPSPTTPSATLGPPDERVDNPYLGGKGYVNPEWRAAAEQEPGGDRVSNTPTGVWLDHVVQIEGTPGSMGLRAHLDAALAQHATYVQVVLNDLPARNCTLAAPDGDFTEGELDRYRREFVDPVVAIETDPAYRSLRIVNVVEVDALLELTVGTSSSYFPRCQAVGASGAYVKGIQYALDRLHPHANLYNYLGIARHGRAGWDTVLTPLATVIRDTVRGTSAGVASVDGFIANTAGYDALKEPFFTAGTVVLGTPVRQSRWVDWNSFVDELPFAQAFRTQLISLGFSSTIGMLVDTSRNGWGGPARPTAVSTSTDVNTFVDQSRVDRRRTADNWCNQAGAGLGERPTAAPAPGIDAYVWMKPPGTSDGASTWTQSGSAGGAVDPMCDPRYDRGTGSARPTGALPDAPPPGVWFPAHFRQLLANAYPPLP